MNISSTCSPLIGTGHHQEEIQKKHIVRAAKAAGIKAEVAWKTFRHSYRSWLDQTEAPMGVQRELMRHASIQTTMNVYGRAMTDSKRQAHKNVVEMVLKQQPEKMVLDREEEVVAVKVV